MYQVAVIGAGGIGSRHLQGLLRADSDMAIHVVDPSEAALQRARTAAGATAVAAGSRKLAFHAGIETLPAAMDLAIIATTSDIRLGVLEQLLRHAAVRFAVLEKVLFPAVSEYVAAAELLISAGTGAWVNCSRRSAPLYREIARALAGDRLLRFDVSGGAWGLGCNGVHFFDLARFLSNETVTEVRADFLDRQPYAAKRKGFVEFGGLLLARTSGGGIISLSSAPGSIAPHLIVIRGERAAFFVDEVHRHCWRVDANGAQAEVSCRLPLQSELTGALADSILSSGCCDLPTFQESTAVHLPFLTALLGHLSAASGRLVDRCLVT